jgi:hypothetical protein
VDIPHESSYSFLVWATLSWVVLINNFNYNVIVNLNIFLENLIFCKNLNVAIKLILPNFGAPTFLYPSSSLPMALLSGFYLMVPFYQLIVLAISLQIVENIYDL